MLGQWTLDKVEAREEGCRKHLRRLPVLPQAQFVQIGGHDRTYRGEGSMCPAAPSLSLSAISRASSRGEQGGPRIPHTSC